MKKLKLKKKYIMIIDNYFNIKSKKRGKDHPKEENSKLELFEKQQVVKLIWNIETGVIKCKKTESGLLNQIKKSINYKKFLKKISPETNKIKCLILFLNLILLALVILILEFLARHEAYFFFFIFGLLYGYSLSIQKIYILKYEREKVEKEVRKRASEFLKVVSQKIGSEVKCDFEAKDGDVEFEFSQTHDEEEEKNAGNEARIDKRGKLPPISIDTKH